MTLPPLPEPFNHALSVAGFYDATWVGDLDDLRALFDAAVEAERERCAQQLDALGCDHCAAALRFKQPSSQGTR